MACCRDPRPGALVLLAIALSGCVTGHLLDAARRRERPVDVTGAALEGDRLVIEYAAEVTDDDGTPIGTTPGAAEIPLSVLRAPVSPPADAVRPSWSSPGTASRGQQVTLSRGEAPAGQVCTGPVLEVVHEGGRDTALVWRDGPASPPGAPVSTAALTRFRTAPWAWPLVPATLAVDSVLGPVLVFFAPAMMVLGE